MKNLHPIPSFCLLAVLLWSAFTASSVFAASEDPLPSPPALPSYLADSVSPVVRAPGLPRASDVPMRGLAPRPIDKKDPHDTLAAIQGFHVTRLEWIYSLNSKFVARVKKMGVEVSGATNPVAAPLGSPSEEHAIRSAAARKLSGGPSIAPWMRFSKPAPLWLCMNNPGTRRIIDERVEKLVRLGVRGIQFDDAGGNSQSLAWGACYCSYCIRKFAHCLEQAQSTISAAEKNVVPRKLDYAAYLQKSKPATPEALELKRLYAEFQKQSTMAFHAQWQRKMKKGTKRPVVVSSNNAGRYFDGPYQPFDFWIGELTADHATPVRLTATARAVRTAGKVQILTMPLEKNPAANPDWKTLARRSLATIYANGMLMEAPWDTYLPTRRANRYFGRPADFADLYAFIRAVAPYLDGYEEAGVQGAGLTGAWDAATAPVSLLEPVLGVYAFTRVNPGDRQAPIVIHLVNWGDVFQVVQIRLELSRLFAGRLVRAEFLHPVPYEARAHAAAFRSKDYTSLVKSVLLRIEADGTVTVPPLTPWGIVVIRPL